MKPWLLFVALLVVGTSNLIADDGWISIAAETGPGAGKHIVFITGDEEYRSEEGMPQIAKILAKHHGFRCTVLFSIDQETGCIDPQVNDNIPGLEALDDADLMVLFTRFRNLPDEQMKHIVDFVESGKPVIGLRTSTHAFDIPGDRTYHRWSWRNGQWDGGFGRQVMGETWVAHHGGHGWQSSSGIIVPAASKHPILKGIKDGDVWDPSDVYTVNLPLPDGCEPLLMGRVLSGMSPDDGPCEAEKRDDGTVFDKNNPMMPVAWINVRKSKNGKKQRIFSSTFGASRSFTREGTRRLLVNACYWCIGLDNQIDAKSKVDIVGEFKPTKFGFGKHTPDLQPSDLMKKAQ
ncbi:MAG: hypothetical protein CMJ95_02350 [Planctomycetes bacterium]|nr:hypothetical protein [Planctomycetota bacterium]